MSALERFLEYIQIDTQSDPYSTSMPSTSKQFDLAHKIVVDLKAMGVENAYVNETCNVYATIFGNKEGVPSFGLIAHMDTAPDYSGTKVKPRIIETYDGNDIVLANGDVTSIQDFPEMVKYKGKTLVVTDGTTLLGCDDKGGIVEIMELVQYLMEHPEVPHGDIHVAFTPDEEVGRGTESFDVEGFHCDFAYTVDGAEIDCIDYENFNAAHAQLHVQGVSIHPGSAKDKMINAIRVAEELDAMLPQHMRPEYTDGYDGFYHLMVFQGSADEVTMEYIIRNHDRALFESQKDWMTKCVALLNEKYKKDVVQVEITDSYYNMRDYFKNHEDIIEYANNAIAKVGLTPRHSAIRGGTDGAMLTYRGLLCPNLGTGGGNFHGKHEFVCVEDMNTMVEILKNLVEEITK